MRIKGSLLKGLFIALAVALIPVTAVSVQKITPGSTCKVLNQKIIFQNKTYTCTKSGKKLVWNKSVVLKPAPTPTPTTTSTPTPASTPTLNKFVPPTLPTSFQDVEKHLSGIIYGAWLKGSNQIASGSSSLGKVQIFSSPSSDPGNPNPILPLKLTSQLYSNFSQPKNVYIIEMNDGDGPWAQQIFNTYADVVYGNVKNAISEICSSKGACRGASAYRNSGWDGILVMGKFPGKSNVEDTKRLQLGMTYSHEYYHTVQWFNGRNNSYNAPTWLLEGSANCVEKIVTFHTSYDDFVQWRTMELRQQYQKPTNFNAAWVEEFLNSFITKKPANPNMEFDYYNGSYDRYYQYLFGGMVTEILISIKSADSVMNIYKYLGEGKTFDQAFQKEFGITWAEALPYISRAIAAQFSQQVKS
jgi:hypothetical protein